MTRKTKHLFRLAASLAAFCWLGAPAHAAEPIRIVAFGDSQTFGHDVSKPEAYPARLEAALRAKGYDVAVDNEGVNGDTTAQGLARLDSAVPAGSQIAIVEFGLNDPRKGVSAPSSRANLMAMVTRLRERGIEVLVYDATPNSALDISSDAAAKGALSYHQPRAAPDMRSNLKTYHLNAKGYVWLAGELEPQLENLIGRVKH